MRFTSLAVSLWFAATISSLACSSGPSGDSNAASAGSVATAGTMSSSGGTAGSAGTVATSGAGGSGAVGIAGQAAGGQAGAAVAGSGGSAGAGVGGSGGSAGSVAVVDPGSEGDGDRVLSPPYTPDPRNTYLGAPVGEQYHFEMLSAESTIYPGDRGDYTRDVWVYVPAQYVPGSAAPFIVVQDGGWAVWFGSDIPHEPDLQADNLPGTGNLPRMLDNMIDDGLLPPMVAIFTHNGGGDGGDSQRGLEYDTVSGVYAEYVDSEVLPRVKSEAMTQLGLDLQLTSDPQGRMTLGGSSGGAGSFSMAWWRPDLFSKVLSFSGTFVRQASPEDPEFPHGCWSYHDFDPYDEQAPNGVIVESEVKPVRVWLEVGENDLGSGSGPESYRDFRLANQRMAAALALKGYHYHFDFAEAAGHVDGNVFAQTLPEALLWLWRGYPIP